MPAAEIFLLNLLDAHDVVSLKFVRHSAVPNARDHCSHRVAELHEVLRADRVIETLAKDNVAEVDAVKGRVSGHMELIGKQLDRGNSTKFQWVHGPGHTDLRTTCITVPKI